jgi:hypothetical protein
VILQREVMPDGLVNTIAATYIGARRSLKSLIVMLPLRCPAEAGQTFLKRFYEESAMQRYVLAFLIFTSAPSAFAIELPNEGSYDYNACWSGVNNVITFSKTHTASSYEMTGATRSNPPGGMFDKNTFRCVGMNASFDGKTTGSTVCEAIDADGDKRLAYFSLGSDGKVTRENITGTGKYEGMVASGTVQPLGPFPVVKAGTFQDCNHQTGTYKLK